MAGFLLETRNSFFSVYVKLNIENMKSSLVILWTFLSSVNCLLDLHLVLNKCVIPIFLPFTKTCLGIRKQVTG